MDVLIRTDRESGRVTYSCAACREAFAERTDGDHRDRFAVLDSAAQHKCWSGPRFVP